MSQAAAQRWKTFLDKVSLRVDELEQEARAGLEGLVETEVLDSAPLSGALSELKARFFGLSKKVDEAWSNTIEPMLGDSSEAEWKALWRDGERLRRRVDSSFGHLEREALANHAKALHVKVQEEADVAVACTQCGAPLVKRIRPRPANVTCQHCRAVTTVRPGLATAMFFGGGALHALGVFGAEEAFIALEQAERAYAEWRHPLQEDLETYRAAVETAWRAWAEEKAKWVPGTKPETIEQDAAVKVSQNMKQHDEREAMRREVRSTAMALAKKRDVAGLVAHLQKAGKNAYFSPEDFLECAAEHEDAQALEAGLEAAFKLEQPSEPKGEWVKEKRDDVQTTVRRRRR